MKIAMRLLTRLTLVAAVLAMIPRPAGALVLCARVKKGQPTGALSLRQQCKGRETAVDPAALGLQGPPGPDGQLRIYGDGSAGTRTVSADETLADANLQYTDFTVSAGITLTVPSGTVIRCSGTFRNDGTIVVSTGAAGAANQFVSITQSDAGYRPPGQGVARAAAGRGERAPAGTLTGGGRPGIGLTEAEARRVLQPGLHAGGGGACGTFEGGSGGGGFTVLAAGPVVNNGTLRADGGFGFEGGGGGAGGVVILASRERFENRGAISADGGRGGGNGPSNGPGGGGGGGIVHALAPVIGDTGTISAGGGAAGPLNATAASGLRFGGGAGGACGGNGGDGGIVQTNDSAVAGVAGSPGYVLQTPVDPTALF